MSQRRARQRWMTDDILDLMEERRCLKGDRERYDEINREVKRRCRERKEEWFNQQCEEVEQLDRMHMHQKKYERVKQITGIKNATRSSTVKDKHGNILMDLPDIMKRWEEYVGDLYEDNRGEKPEIVGEMEGPPIMQREVENAIRQMSRGKSVGEDQVSVEMVEAAGEIGGRKLTNITNRIHDTGYIPHAVEKSIFITILKKEGATECGQHRTISIISQTGKIVLRVILNRMRNKVDQSIDQEQYGLKKAKVPPVQSFLQE